MVTKLIFHNKKQTTIMRNGGISNVSLSNVATLQSLGIGEFNLKSHAS